MRIDLQQGNRFALGRHQLHQWEDADFANDLVLLERTKNGMRRSVVLNLVSRGVLIRKRRVRAEVCRIHFGSFHITRTPHANVGDRVKDVKTSFV